MKVQPIRSYNTYKPVFKNNPQPVHKTSGQDDSNNNFSKKVNNNQKFKKELADYLNEIFGILIDDFISPKVNKEAKEIQSNIDEFYTRVWGLY